MGNVMMESIARELDEKLEESDFKPFTFDFKDRTLKTLEDFFALCDRNPKMSEKELIDRVCPIASIA